MFWKVIDGILMSTYGVGALVTILNNSSSNNRIRRKGYEIKPVDVNSISENIKYFIKDFGFLFIPVYNLIHSIKQTIQNDNEFDNNKIAKLLDRDRLEKKSEKEVVKEVKRVEEPKREEVKAEVKTESPKLPARRSKTFEELDCYEKREYYKSEYDRVLNLRNSAKNDGASVTILNRYTEELEAIVENYRKANRECKINDLKMAKDSLDNSKGSQKTLVR